MKLARSSGILLHPTSLPSRFGIGDLGVEAYRFVDFLAEAGQRLWQVLPLGPTGYGDSPYQCFSAFAGNPLLISLEKLCEANLLSAEELKSVPHFSNHEMDYGAVMEFKLPLLRKSFQNFKDCASESDVEQFHCFCRRNASWLEDYALFISIKAAHCDVAWTQWEPTIAARQPDAIARWREDLAEEMATRKFWEYLFSEQWAALKNYCHSRGVQLMGDVPIYVAHDSADVWTHREFFHLDEQGDPTVVAGVPPDYFSATGQLWGNPLYRWDALAQTGFAWWIERFRAVLSLVDIVRLDHFRGFEAFWEVPASRPTAVHGRWVQGPGPVFFEAIQSALGDFPIVAEDLGFITPGVIELKNRFGFPGMAVLQFAFGRDPKAPFFRPPTYVRNMVVYTGTHDNDTTLGWWSRISRDDRTGVSEEIKKEKESALQYLGTDGREMNWAFIRAILASVADVAIIPLQDVLGLGSEARMNLPGTPRRNWRWRFTRDLLTPEIRDRLKEMTVRSGRTREEA